MDCTQAREGLWPPERPKLVGEEIAEARRHVAECPDCTEFFAQDRALLDSYERLRAEKAPIDVRERVFDSLSKARWDALQRQDAESGSRPVWRHGLVPATVLAAALAVIAFGSLDRPGTAVVADGDDPGMFVEDYLRRAVGQDHIETSDPDEIVRFLQRELGVSLKPLEIEGLELIGAEICLLEGHRGAMIVYKKDGAAVSHYLVPRDGAAPRGPELSGQRSGPGTASMPVVTWSTPEVEQALVGELGSAQLLQLAASGASKP